MATKETNNTSLDYHKKNEIMHSFSCPPTYQLPEYKNAIKSTKLQEGYHRTT
jgi:hypothetical protein